MKRIIEFEIPGEPCGKGRPKFTTIGGHARAITPQKTVNYENLVKMCFMEKNEKILEGMLSAEIICHYSIPQSTSNKKRISMLNGEIRPTKKPDLDNIAKIVLDSLNKIAYNDDSQIVEIYISKYYSSVPFVEVKLSEV